MTSLICGIYWINWTNKQNGDRLIDGEQMTALGDVGGGVEGLNKKRKRFHGHGQCCGDCGLGGGGRGYKGITGNGKNTIKMTYLKKQCRYSSKLTVNAHIVNNT